MNPSGFQSLAEFQRCAGIPLDDQILLIGNRHWPAGYFNCLVNPNRGKSGARTSLLGRIENFVLRKLGREVCLPKKIADDEPEKLFLGYSHRSFDNLRFVDQLFQMAAHNRERKFLLLLGKGDYDFDEAWAQKIPPNVLRVAANNMNVSNASCHYFPMGRDFRSAELFADFPPSSEKEFLVYCNFSVDTHPVRQRVFDLLQNQSFVKFDHMGKFREYSLTRDEFFRRVAGSKFCVCPRGNAFDTFRMWDSLYVGTIPIVVREANFHRQLEDLPILFLDSYDEFSTLNPEKLEQVYEEMTKKKYNYSKLRLSFWMSQFEAGLN